VSKGKKASGSGRTPGSRRQPEPQQLTSSSAGATASFRGYRRQCLYTLHRTLTMSADASVQPEGIEDLAVFGGTQLAEVCQVKSVAEPLAVHHLRSARGSFFTRAAAVLRSDPTAVLRIVSFGSVGPELAKAIAANGPERDHVVAKLSGDASASAEELRNVLVQLQPVEEVTETQLSEAVEALLAQLVTGIDTKTSMDVLLFSVYRAAEGRISLARARVEQQLVDIGRYLAERAAHHAEWFTTVEPLSDATIDRDRAAELANEFHRGMQARWEHVVAGVTVPRPGLLGRAAALKIATSLSRPGPRALALDLGQAARGCPIAARRRAHEVGECLNERRLGRVVGFLIHDTTLAPNCGCERSERRPCSPPGPRGKPVGARGGAQRMEHGNGRSPTDLPSTRASTVAAPGMTWH